MMFTDQGAFTEVTNEVTTILLLGLFISRGLVSTLLLKPAEYGLMDITPSNLGISNLKVWIYTTSKSELYIKGYSRTSPLAGSHV